jgi:putative ABC transport system permease protein
MTLKTIVICNLRRRKAKAAFVLLGLLIGTTAVVAFVTMSDALTSDINRKLDTYGANILIVPKTEALSLTYGGLSIGGISFEMQELRQEELDKIAGIKNAANVAAVGPMVLGPVQVDSHRVLLAGVDFEQTKLLRPWWIWQGGLPEKDGVLAGAEVARVLGLQQGSRFDANGHTFRVSGILEPTGSQDDQILFVRLATAQELLDKRGHISMAEVAALCAACPIDAMVEQISSAIPGAKVMAIRQVVKGRMETLGQFRRFSFALSGLVLLVGGLVVLVTMTGSVRERTSEFGIFRAIGFCRSHIVRIVLLEAAIISASAGAIGYVLGFGSSKLALPFFTESHNVAVPFDPALAAGVLSLAILLGIFSSVYPAVLAARLDPNEALRAL